jgi:hypothetical protein
MSHDMQIRPPEARRLVARRESLTWVLIGLGLLTAGALSFAAGVVRWWEPCFTGGFDSDACITRQNHESDLTGFTVLPSDQRQAAILLASSTLLLGLLWFSLLLLGRKSTLFRVAAGLGGAYAIAVALPDLLWHTQGWRPFGGEEILPVLHLPGLILVPCVIVALLAGRPDDTGRLGLLSTGLLAASVFTGLFEYFFWSGIYASHDTPPGSGWVQSGMYAVSGVGILYLTLRRWRRGKPAS